MIGGAFQFIRTNPLNQPGAIGVFDLLQGPTGIPHASFPSPGGQMSSFVGTSFTLEYTKVPEPTVGIILMLVVLLPFLRRSISKISPLGFNT